MKNMFDSKAFDRGDWAERMMDLPPDTRRCRTWRSTEQHTEPCRGPASLGDLTAAIDGMGEGLLNVILGVRLDRAALAAPEDAVLGSIRNALVRGWEIAALFDSATPKVGSALR